MLEIPNILLQYLGIISIGLIVTTGFLMVKNDPHSDHSSISAYAGSTRSQARLGFLALIVFSMPLYIWILIWLIPQYNLSIVLYPFVLISFICHVLLVKFPLIPSNGRKHFGNVLHLGAGSLIALSTLGLILTLLFSPLVRESLTSTTILMLTCSYMILSLLAYVTVRNKRYFIEFEIIYILLFALCVGVVTMKL